MRVILSARRLTFWWGEVLGGFSCPFSVRRGHLINDGRFGWVFIMCCGRGDCRSLDINLWLSFLTFFWAMTNVLNSTMKAVGMILSEDWEFKLIKLVESHCWALRWNYVYKKTKQLTRLTKLLLAGPWSLVILTKIQWRLEPERLWANICVKTYVGFMRVHVCRVQP